MTSSSPTPTNPHDGASPAGINAATNAGFPE